MLYIADIRSKTLHTICLIMRISGNKNKRTIAFRTRIAAVDQAVETLLRYNCTKIAMPSLKIDHELRYAKTVDCQWRTPRLCILPSLLLLASLGLIAIVLNLRNDSEDVIYTIVGVRVSKCRHS